MAEGRSGRLTALTAKEAVSHLRQGLELLESIADEKVRAELELGLQATIALALSAAKGFAMPEVEQAYARAQPIENVADDRLQRSEAI